MKRLLAAIFLCFSITFSYSQDFSNKGKEFWIAYSSHIDGTSSLMAIYITSNQNATGNIQVGTNNIPFSVNANQAIKKILGTTGPVDGTNTDVYLTKSDGTQLNAAIKVTSDVPIVVYAHIIKSARSAATLVLPTPVLGTEYIVPSYPSNGTSGGSNPNIGEFAVIATQANTTIEVTPSINGGNGRVAGVPYPITLQNPGDVYQFQGVATGDISGTVVKSISTATTGCKPIAVFAGSTWSAFDCQDASGGDNLYQELFPVRSWGKRFITSPFVYREYDIFRIYIKDTATKVKVTENGITQTLPTSQLYTPGKFYEISTANPIYIDANQPISVVQFMTSLTCSNGCQTGGGGGSVSKQCAGDPEMVVLNPVEQTLKDITFFSAHQNSFKGFNNITNVEYHYVNVIIDKNHKSSVKIDGANPTSSFIDIPSTNYSYLQEDVTNSSAVNPVHHIVADTGFSAIVYGTGRVESYGYNGGTNVTDLYQYITLANQYGSVNFPAVCINTPFYFSITLPYQPIQLNWDFNGDTNLLPHNAVINNSPVFDRTFIKDGKSLYVYKLPNPYVFKKTGIYNVKVTSNNPTTDGCNGLQEIDYQVNVYNNPIANFTINTNGCTNVPLTFTDNSQTSGHSIIKWLWNFGDGTKDSIANPSKLYLNGGTFPIKYTIVTDVGCFADTVKNVTLAVPPLAKFGIDNITCANSPVVITDSSSVTAPGTIAKWYWDFGNGKKDTSTVSNGFAINYTDTGTYVITLLVESNTGCSSVAYSRTIHVNAKPKVGFVLPQVCLDDAFAQFTDTSTITDNSTFSWLWNFGDPKATLPLNGNTSILKNPKHKYADTGVYNVQLIVTSNNFCKDSLTENFTVNGSTPKADFVVLNSNALCSNDSVRIKNTSTVDFGSITKVEIYWDTVNDPTSKTIDNFPKSNKIYSTVYNSFQQPATETIYIKMLSYSGVTCVNEKVVAITLHQSPKVQFIAIPSICNDTIPRIITQATEIGGVVGTSVFTGSGIVNTNTGLFNPMAVNAGIYTIKYTYTSTGFGCMDTTSQTITVLKSPIAKFGVANPTCVNNNIAFLDSSLTSVGSIVKWDWNFGNNILASKSNSLPFSIQYNAVNTYSVTLKITTDSGCHNQITVPVTVHPLPRVYFGLPSVCLPNGKAEFLDSSTISDGTAGLFTYHWNFGDAVDTTSSTVKNAIHKYSDTIPKDVVLTVTSKDGCQDSLQRKLTAIYPQPKAAYMDTGSITVTLSIHNSQNCESDIFRKNIIVNPYPIIQLPKTLNFLQGGVLSIKPTYYYGQHLSYLWTPNQFMVTDTVLYAQVYPDDDKRYLLTITANSKCSDTASVEVIVLKTPNIPNVFSPNGDGINDTWVIEHLDSYPGCTVTVFDRGGQQVFYSFGYGTPWNGKSNGKELPVGTYYYIIDPKNGRGLLNGSITILR